MGIDAGTPPGLRETIQRIAEEAVAKFARSGFLRNASISDGGLTIKGGFFRFLSKATGGTAIVYMGPLGDPLPDGTPQQGLLVNRSDGARVLDLYDADVSDGQVRQALNWRDRGSNVVIADDTNSGQGLARPYIPFVFYPATFEGLTSTTNTTFTTVWRATVYKQHPRMVVGAAAVMNAAGQTGEYRVLVNGTPLGSTVAVTDASISNVFGPAAVTGTHEQIVQVEIQARCVTPGQINTAVFYGYGLQS